MVKASGLAAGKGVVVASSAEEACAAVDEMLTDQKFGSAGNTIVVEELLEGEEVSVGIPVAFNSSYFQLMVNVFVKFIDFDFSGPWFL